MNPIRNAFQNFLQNNHQKKKTIILLLAALGLLFIFISNLLFTSKTEEINEEIILNDEKQLSDSPTINEIEQMYENNLVQLLNEVSGISNVDVIVNVDSTYIQIYDSNEISRKQTTDETDTNGGKRKVEDHTDERITSYKRKDNEDVPVHIQTKKPIIRGVLIAANGVEDIEKNREVVESVAKLFDIPTYRISVIAK